MIAEKTILATARVALLYYYACCVRYAYMVGAALAAALGNAPHRLTSFLWATLATLSGGEVISPGVDNLPLMAYHY